MRFGGITLKGVFINGTQAKAFMISTQNPLGAWIQPGEEIAGWRLVAIEPDQVTLEGHNETLVVPSSVRRSTTWAVPVTDASEKLP